MKIITLCLDRYYFICSLLQSEELNRPKELIFFLPLYQRHKFSLYDVNSKNFTCVKYKDFGLVSPLQKR